jgi:hypothetical protein
MTPPSRAIRTWAHRRSPDSMSGEVMDMQTFQVLELDGQDAFGRWHPVAAGQCQCGCPYVHAIDDCSIRWLGGDWESDAQAHLRCIDRECACHRRSGDRIPRAMPFRKQKTVISLSDARQAGESLPPVLATSWS